jgi:PAS domain S-box-containing protein
MTETERALGALYSEARMPVVVLRPTGHIVAANRALVAKYGYSRDELKTMKVHDFLAEERDVDGEIAKSMLEQPSLLNRRRHRKKNGEIMSVLPSAFPVTVLGERLLVSFLQDVTQLDAAEAQAQRAREEARELEVCAKALRAELLAADRLATIGRVAAGIAHEVNNPAALVTLNLGMVRERLKNGDPRVDESLAMLDDCLEAMVRIRDIVHDVKGFSGERAPAPVDLSRLAANVVRMVKLDERPAQRGAPGASGGRTYVQVDSHLEPEVFARVRGSRVSQVLTNLLMNAAQALPDAPAGTGASGPAEHHILLRTFLDGEAACIEVSDTGPGVPAHLAERIFEPFFTTRAGAGGTGLGLWLAKGIIEEEGGTLALSDRPGGGAVFRVSLPAAAP